MKVKKKYIKSRKEKFSQGLKVALLLGILLVIGFFYIHLKNLTTLLDYSLNQEIGKNKKLKREKERLEKIVFYLHSPMYLGEKGREMGMIEMEISDIRELK
ncbi:MAG: hypothetical protein GXO71_00500 [Caldiserica bacterium]|nr:hypothetical protein [Caldisericota bacterium]